MDHTANEINCRAEVLFQLRPKHYNVQNEKKPKKPTNNYILHTHIYGLRR